MKTILPATVRVLKFHHRKEVCNVCIIYMLPMHCITICTGLYYYSIESVDTTCICRDSVDVQNSKK